MPKILLVAITIVSLILVSTRINAQQKYEKESRLKPQDVPAQALQFVDSLAPDEKIKWYFEEGMDRSSIEAKFKLHNQKYSIEFDSTGRLEDIEILMHWSKLARAVRNTIKAQLEKDCTLYKIRKTQIQYSGERSVLLSNIQTGECSEDSSVRYELVVKCRSAGDIGLYEYLFSCTGEKLERAQIIIKTSSNLEY